MQYQTQAGTPQNPTLSPSSADETTIEGQSNRGRAARIEETLVRRPLTLGEASFEAEYSSFYDSLLCSEDRFNADWIDLLSRELVLEGETDRTSVEYRSVPLLVLRDGQRISVFSYRGNSEAFLLELGEKTGASVDLQSHWQKLRQSKASSGASDIQRLTDLHGLPYFNDPKFDSVYQRTIEHETQLKKMIAAYRPTLVERVSDFALNLTAHYALIRIHLLKFLAILPSLDHDQSGEQVKRILLETIRRLKVDQARFASEARTGQAKGDRIPLPAPYVWGATLTAWVARLVPARPLAAIVRAAVRWTAKRFIAGETIEASTESLTSLRRTKREATLDQLGELVVSEKEADQYRDRVLELVRGLGAAVPVGERNGAGILAAHVSIKVSALSSEFIPEAFDHTFERVAPRLKQILLEAKEHQVFINIDAEHYHVRDLIFEVYRKVLLETPELKGWADTGIVVQAYLRDAYRHLMDIAALAKERGVEMPVRLVKGAYWDAETIEAEAHSFPSPQFLNKEETDVHFRQLVYRIFELSPSLKLCLASHNIYDHAFARALREELFPQTPEFEHQCLHMTYEALSTALAEWNVPVRNYVPVGSLLVGMAYLVRRIMENSSQVGFLSKMRDHDFELSKTPLQLFEDRMAAGTQSVDPAQTVSSEFLNTSPVRLYRADSRVAFEVELAGQSEIVAAAHSHVSGEVHEVRSPSDPSQIVGRIQFGRKEDVEGVLNTLSASFESGEWSQSSAATRSAAMVRAAQLMTIRRLELASLIVREAAKSMNEALADVDEAIDFLQFYARGEIQIERSFSEAARARGVVAVIAPWNFPLAIPCGMTAAALVAGNSVVLKSAEQTPLIADRLVEILIQAGVPSQVLAHLPGDGEEVGAPLVQDSRVSSVVFTGSKAVGTWIAAHAGARVAGDRPVKVITEMGGKNAVVVTGSAELDETVDGLLYSAFAHGGQKCSALSRVIVDESVASRLSERLAAAAEDLTVGSALAPSTFVNPVITSEDQERLRAAAKASREEADAYSGEVLVDRSQEVTSGHGVGPVMVSLPADRARDRSSMAQQEHFGPIVHLVPYRTLDEAVELANGTEYGLTGGVFSQSQDEIDQVTSQVQVGNFYVNRSNTGARVGVEPFGGFKHSGTGPKAGGIEYLKAFHAIDRQGRVSLPVPREVTEEGIPAAWLRGLEKRIDALGATPKSWKAPESWNRHLSLLETRWPQVWRDGIPNRTIPGQISFDDLRLRRPDAVWLVGEGEPEVADLQMVATTLAMGIELKVVGADRLSDDWQKWLKRLAKQGLEVSRVEGDDLPAASTYFLSCSTEELSTRLSEVYERAKDSEWMPMVTSKAEGPNVFDFEAHLRLVTLSRSMAVNTMRHGAPLELDS